MILSDRFFTRGLRRLPQVLGSQTYRGGESPPGVPELLDQFADGADGDSRQIVLNVTPVAGDRLFVSLILTWLITDTIPVVTPPSGFNLVTSQNASVVDELISIHVYEYVCVDGTSNFTFNIDISCNIISPYWLFRDSGGYSQLRTINSGNTAVNNVAFSSINEVTNSFLIFVGTKSNSTGSTTCVPMTDFQIMDGQPNDDKRGLWRQLLADTSGVVFTLTGGGNPNKKKGVLFSVDG